MSSPDFFIANDCPDNLPSRDDIVEMCKVAGYDCRGFPYPNKPSEPISVWIKYGSHVTMGEALTQDMVAKVFNTNPEASVRVPRVYQAFSSPILDCKIGYIVMEYIDAPDCDARDSKLVAKAVQSLISVTGPSSAPGPVGGGPIEHSFFYDWRSPITYATVEELDQHVNGILTFKGDTRRVSLVDDARNGLRLCPCDINPGNFKKDRDGKVVALDFGATCFLPPSFFAVAVAKAVDIFTLKVARHVKYPQSSDTAAIVSASCALVPFGSNDIGQPVTSRLSRTSEKPPPAQAILMHCRLRQSIFVMHLLKYFTVP